MSNQLWQDKWQNNEIAFHQNTINPLLQQFLPQLQLNAGDRVLVPLCGKSLDMDWFKQRRLRVLGIELSTIAIEAYFDALSVKPQRQIHGNFIRWWYKQTEIWCGDIFDLNLVDLQKIKLLYDCAALTALPTEIRLPYVQHFSRILPNSSQIMLMTTESPDTRVDNSALTIDSEVNSLYQTDYRIQLLYGQDCLKIDPAYPFEPACELEEKVYLMDNLSYLNRL